MNGLTELTFPGMESAAARTDILKTAETAEISATRLVETAISTNLVPDIYRYNDTRLNIVSLTTPRGDSNAILIQKSSYYQREC